MTPYSEPVQPFDTRCSPAGTQSISEETPGPNTSIILMEGKEIKGKGRRVNKLSKLVFGGLYSHYEGIYILIDPLVTPLAALGQEIDFFTL